METLDQFVQQNLGMVVIVLGAVAVAGLVVAAGNRSRVASVFGRFAWVADKNTGEVDTLGKLLETVTANAREVETLAKKLDATIAEGRTHFKRLGLVRFDAFDGVAGQQSFALCLLDDRGCGVIISSLVGSNFNRSYALEITDGVASRKLGNEEDAALKMALSR